MGAMWIDALIMIVYLGVMVGSGLWSRSRPKTDTDYFLGSRNMPWPTAALSIVATETSTLTVISLPAVAYGGSMLFMQLTIGYLLGRVLVAWLMLPAYFEGTQDTAYSYLAARFGDRVKGAAASTFIVTRLLADGVRLFATAIPLRVLLLMFGIEVGFAPLIVAIALVTLAYTLTGGLRAVMWMDVWQLLLYVLGGLATLWVITSGSEGWSSVMLALDEAGKRVWLDLQVPSLNYILTQPYAFWTAVLGGAVFSMASHGTDHLIVQRLLSTGNLASARKALVSSGVLVMLQSLLFLYVGALLWVEYAGASAADLGLSRADAIFPKFILEGLPTGLRGLLIAGIFAAAMSTLSSSLNSLASTTRYDLLPLLRPGAGQAAGLRQAQWITVFWTVVMVGFASMFTNEQNPVVELGLAIATFTYGGLLGLFAVGRLVPRLQGSDAIGVLILTILTLTFLIKGLYFDPIGGWAVGLDRPSAAKTLAWPWYTLVGTVASVLYGWVWGRLRPPRT